MTAQRWKILPIPTDDEQAYLDAIRLNSLGSLFFFVNHTLGRNRLAKLHWQMCQALETADLHAVFEIPMGHFKTTVGTEGLSMWWALPFTARDEFQMRALGYGDEWIRWMKSIHDQNTRTLITHEVEALAIKMGKNVDEHYQNNRLFRAVFKDILPDSNSTWNDHSKFHKRKKDSAHGEGTYEYRGVGQSLQSMHFSGIINDDSFGREAQQNSLKGDGNVAEGIYRWWKQTTTRYDSETFTQTGIGRQLVIGNRWGHADLNSNIRKNHPEFKIESHSAEGGCCKLHPANTPIFPEEYSMERLNNLRKTLQDKVNGNYDYVHFYLNKSVMPEECIFKEEWKRFFRFKQSRPDLPLTDIRNTLNIEHNAYAGLVREDINAGVLHKRMIVDLAHAKKRRRCNHAIVVIGYDPETERVYLLDVWAKKVPYGDLTDMMYKIGHRWNMSEMWLETVAAQDIMKFHLEERNRRESRPIAVNELAYDNSENAKINRIESLQPLFKNEQFWCHPSHAEFLSEYDAYPGGLVDVLDTLGYSLQTLEGFRSREVMDFISQQHEEFAGRQVGAGGY